MPKIVKWAIFKNLQVMYLVKSVLLQNWSSLVTRLLNFSETSSRDVWFRSSAGASKHCCARSTSPLIWLLEHELRDISSDRLSNFVKNIRLDYPRWGKIHFLHILARFLHITGIMQNSCKCLARNAFPERIVEEMCCLEESYKDWLNWQDSCKRCIFAQLG